MMELCFNEHAISNPTGQEVETAIRALDGTRRTEVTFGGSGGDPYISVGGGGNGQYFVFIWTAEERNLILLDPAGRGEDMVIMKAGGQAVRLPARQVVALPSAIRAARWYFEHADADPAMTWLMD